MSLPPAALPGHQLPTAPVEQHPHPGASNLRACPNCQDPTSIVATYTVRAAVAVEVSDVAAASVTEVQPIYGTLHADEPGNYQQPIKVGCDNCQWSYEGPEPLGKLVSA